MEYTAIAFFDPQKDYLPEHPTVADLNKWRPSTALFACKEIPPIISYNLLVPTEHKKAALRIKLHLESLLEKGISHRVKDKTAAQKLITRAKVNLCDIKYSNVWDIAECQKAIIDKLPPLRDIKTETTIILNLCGGTTAERTALYLTILKLIRDSKHLHLRTIREKPTPISTPKKHDLIVSNAGDANGSTGLLADGIRTTNPQFRGMLDTLESLIKQSKFEKILIAGPTGAGKSHLAKLIISFRQALDTATSASNCISVNIAALAPSLIESELFGYAPGAYTGALKEGRAGIFEIANNGIVFLDEIGELPMHLQAKLLTVLDGAPFQRVGGSKPITTRFMFICGTNKDLAEECRNGRFRYDLLQRISVWHYKIPSLSQRPEDIESILQRFQGEWRDEFKYDVLFEKSARRLFLEFAAKASWPGNFREFNSMFRHLAMFAEKATISLSDVRREISVAQQNFDPTTTEPASADSNALAECPYNLIDLVQLSYAIDICKTTSSADEAGRILFNARRRASLQNGAKFNGTTYLQRLLGQFGLKACYKNSVFKVVPNQPQAH